VVQRGIFDHGRRASTKQRMRARQQIAQWDRAGNSPINMVFFLLLWGQHLPCGPAYRSVHFPYAK
jgi:hypothetical protein